MQLAKPAFSRKLTAILVAAMLLCGIALLPAMATPAHAASTKSMSKLGLKWDLKPNKKMKVTTYYAGIGKKNITLTVKNLKIRNASKKGYKKLTYTLEVYQTFKPSTKQVHIMANSKIAKTTGFIGGDCYSALVDYKTGYDLDENDLHGVKTKTSGWNYSNVRQIKDKHGCAVAFTKKMTATCTSTYPASYKGLCLGIGGNNTPYPSIVAEKDFWAGKKSFANTILYKKGKRNSHWMRIN